MEKEIWKSKQKPRNRTSQPILFISMQKVCRNESFCQKKIEKKSFISKFQNFYHIILEF